MRTKPLPPPPPIAAVGTAPSTHQSRGACLGTWIYCVFLLAMSIVTVVNYTMLERLRATSNGGSNTDADSVETTTGTPSPSTSPSASSSQPPSPTTTNAPEEETPEPTESPEPTAEPTTPQPPTAPPGDDRGTDPPDHEENHTPYEKALAQHREQLKKTIEAQHIIVVVNGERKELDLKHLQETDWFQDLEGLGDHGVLLPHNPHVPQVTSYKACDPTDTDFTPEKDRECQSYLRDWNNMRSIKVLAAHLNNGRTIKFRIYYHHAHLSAIVKVSQKKFVYEPSSEYLAFSVDRALQLHHIPPTVFAPLPLDYLRAACGVMPPVMSWWFEEFVPRYDYIQRFFFDVDGKQSANVTIQLWMNDVHSALYGYLALNYANDAHFYRKFYLPDAPNAAKTPFREHRKQALGDVMDRFLFDFLIGNTDRGMNDHNNFVFGGCSLKEPKTACHPPKNLSEAHKGRAKYAFLDHGSSLHTHKEPDDNPFSKNITDVCRIRRSTFVMLKSIVRTKEHRQKHIRPLIERARPYLVPGLFNIVRQSTYKLIQDRSEKVVEAMEKCIVKYGEKTVLDAFEY